MIQLETVKGEMKDMFEKLLEKLKELFQLNQPELDFGIYRIMHAKSNEITKFLEQDLLPQVKDALSGYQSVDRARVERELDEAINQAKGLGVDPDSVEKVKALRAQLADAPNAEAVEAEVYEALYKFFRRYYTQGDFLSRRVYKKDVYAIPYEGEEVALHWANKDQYYIKSSETLRDYAFRLQPEDAANPMRVHFRVVGADEEEHNTVKTAESKQRVFILAPNRTPEVVDGELHIYFQYEQSDKKQNDLNAKSVDWFKASANKDLTEWKTELLRFAPIKSNESRTLLEKHLEQYTARNTFDYFIHKDLGGFLRRELDFFIKNEIMHLDDIEDATAVRADQYLAKIRAVKNVAVKIITFLAELEDFQKKLWLKKKFVVKSDYLISPGLLSSALLNLVVRNKSQINDWVQHQLLNGEKISGDELRSRTGLLVDTRFFDEADREALVAEVPDLDKTTVGWLLAGDNYQSLRFIERAFSNRVDMVYADPPYNTEGDFIYKDSYKHSTWLTMMDNRLQIAYRLLSDEGRFFCSIDDRENDNLLKLLKSIWLPEGYLGSITWEKRTKPQNTETAAKMLQSKAEYIHPFVKIPNRQEFFREAVSEKTYPERDKIGEFRIERLEEMSAEDIRARSTMVFPILGVSPRVSKQWKVGKEYVEKKLVVGDIFLKGEWPHRKVRPNEEDGTTYRPFWSHFFDKETYGTAEEGLALVDKDLGFGKGFQTVKPLRLLEKLVFHAARDGGIVLDPFAGSGTTAHAVLSTRRAHGRDLRFIMCEAGTWFDTLLVPRVKKAVFSNAWRDGRPTTTGLPLEDDLQPVVVQVVYLEQYEDTLNNLDLKRPEAIDGLFSGGDVALREDYVLRYMLDVETRGSTSLLNMSAFSDPRKYTLRVKSPGTDETVETNVDLIETFNWLLGLRVQHVAASETYSAEFSEKDKRTVAKLAVSGTGSYWFRQVTGRLPDGREALIVWRTLSNDAARDEAALLAWFESNGHLVSEFLDVVYINGDSNLGASKPPSASWSVQSLEAHFHDLMFEGSES